MADYICKLCGHYRVCKFSDNTTVECNRYTRHEASEALYALADMVNQFAYNTTYYGKDAVCDAGLSALENAFWVLQQAGCKMNANGTIQRTNLWRFMEEKDNERKAD